MTSHKPDNNERPPMNGDIDFELAKSPEPSRHSGARNVPTGRFQSANTESVPDRELSRQELLELEQAKSALNFLDQVRNDLINEKERVELEQGTVTATAQVTLNNGEAEVEADPKHFGRFRLIEKVGEGGFACVYRAHDPFLKREVALKIPKPHSLASDDSRMRFQRESQAAAMLSHPAIVPVFEASSLGPVNFIVSGYCPGKNLAQWLHENKDRLEPRTAVAIVAKLADAVEHAHQRGIIHRDIKPANILVEESTAPLAQRVRITDFGLARLMESEQASLTMDGEVLGTPAYMSPEQALGNSELDASTDIFSLGVILYQLLTGEIPFLKSNHLATMNAVTHDSPPTPSKLYADISRDLDAICMKCLRKSPQDRYVSAFDLHQDLSAWLEGRSVKARPLSKIERLWRAAKQYPMLTFALGLAAVSMIGGATFGTLQTRLANQQRIRAESNVERLQATIEDVLEGYSNFDSKTLNKPRQRELIDKLLVAHRQLLQDDANQVKVVPEIIESYIRISALYRKLGEFQRSKEICELAQKALDAGLIESKNETLARFQSLGIALSLESMQRTVAMGHPKETIEVANQAIKRLGSLESENENLDQLFDLYHYLAMGQIRDHRDREAIVSYQKSYELARKSSEAEPKNVFKRRRLAKATGSLGEIRRKTGDTEAGLELINRAFKEFKNLHDEKLADCSYYLGGINRTLGEHYLTTKDLELAEKHLVESFDELKEAVSRRPEEENLFGNYVRTVHALSTLRRAQKDHDAEKSLLESGRTLSKNIKADFNRFQRRIFFSKRLAALTFEKFDQPDQARELFDEAIEIASNAVKTFPDREHFRLELSRVYRAKAYFLIDTNDMAAADETMNKSRDLAFETLKAYPQMVDFVNNAMFHDNVYLCKQAHFEQAQSELKKLVRIAPKQMEIRYGAARSISTIAEEHSRTNRPVAERHALESLAMSELETAIELGFRDASLLKKQRQFKRLRGMPRFKNIVAGLE